MVIIKVGYGSDDVVIEVSYKSAAAICFGADVWCVLLDLHNNNMIMLLCSVKQVLMHACSCRRCNLILDEWCLLHCLQLKDLNCAS